MPFYSVWIQSDGIIDKNSVEKYQTSWRNHTACRRGTDPERPNWLCFLYSYFLTINHSNGESYSIITLDFTTKSEHSEVQRVASAASPARSRPNVRRVGRDDLGWTKRKSIHQETLKTSYIIPPNYASCNLDQFFFYLAVSCRFPWTSKKTLLSSKGAQKNRNRTRLLNTRKKISQTLSHLAAAAIRVIASVFRN